MKCPRCGGAMSDVESTVGSVYRGSVALDRGCNHCKLAVYSPAELASRAQSTEVDLSRSPLCRHREAIDAPCGNCGADVRDTLHLSWNGIRDVVVEVCASCRLVAISSADGERLTRMLAAAEPMHRSG